MKRLLKNKKGSAFVWIVFLISLAAVGIVYTIMAQPFSLIYNATWDDIEGTPGEDTINKLVTIYKISPLIVVAGLIIWAFVHMVRRDQGSEIDTSFF